METFEHEIEWLVRVHKFRLQADFAHPYELNNIDKRDMAHKLLNEAPVTEAEAREQDRDDGENQENTA
jgi:hypothetical protein